MQAFNKVLDSTIGCTAPKMYSSKKYYRATLTIYQISQNLSAFARVRSVFVDTEGHKFFENDTKWTEENEKMKV